ESGLEPVFDISARFRQSLSKILITLGLDPGIVLRPVLQPSLVDLGSEQFSERRTRRFLPRSTAGKIYVRIHGKADAGQNIFQRLDILAAQAAGIAQAKPGFDSTFIALCTVVIDDAQNPLAALFAIRHVGKDRGVLDGNADLVI